MASVTQPEPSPISDREMAEAMVRYGGSFVVHLGQAFLFADGINRAKILATRPDYCQQYRDLARLKREQAKTDPLKMARAAEEKAERET